MTLHPHPLYRHLITVLELITKILSSKSFGYTFYYILEVVSSSLYYLYFVFIHLFYKENMTPLRNV